MEAQDEEPKIEYPAFPPFMQLIIKERDIEEKLCFSNFLAKKCLALQKELDAANDMLSTQLDSIKNVMNLMDAWKTRSLCQEIDIEIVQTRLLLSQNCNMLNLRMSSQ